VNRTTHNLLGATSGFAFGVAAGLPWWATVGSSALASITSDGPTSPDIDQYRAWKRLDRWVPDELLGHGGPLQHRGLSHWWGLPAMLAGLAWHVGAGWYVWALIIGLISHLVGDLLCGQADGWAHRGPGIPLLPWWGHVGLGLKSGGRLERFVLAPVILGGLLWLSFGTVAQAVQH
jgi:LexA-binding, inner membrane-associated putative hydrolase